LDAWLTTLVSKRSTVAKSKEVKPDQIWLDFLRNNIAKKNCCFAGDDDDNELPAQVKKIIHVWGRNRQTNSALTDDDDNDDYV
jgi:hypothetical protein